MRSCPIRYSLFAICVSGRLQLAETLEQLRAVERLQQIALSAGALGPHDRADVDFDQAKHDLRLDGASMARTRRMRSTAVMSGSAPSTTMMSGMSAMHISSASSAAAGFDHDHDPEPPRMRFATFRMTLESSTNMQRFISRSFSSPRHYRKQSGSCRRRLRAMR